MKDMTETAFNPGQLGMLRGSMSGDDFRHLVHLFAQDLGQRLDLLETALLAGDRAEIAVTAHSIRGLAGNMGAQALAQHAAALEDAAPGSEAGALAAGFARLRDAALGARRGLEAMLAA